LLIETGINFNTNDYLSTPVLMPVVKTEDLKMVRLLIKAGADVNASNQSGETILMSAVKTGNLKIVEMLINEGANTNESFFIWACKDSTEINKSRS
jgi:ankyrin repeat protein